MTGYVDTFANKSEAAHDKIPSEANLHLARSCFAVLLRQAHIQALAEGATHDTFRSEIGAVIDSQAFPIYDAVDNSRHLPGKRQPSLRESFDATLDRYKVIDGFTDAFSTAADAMVYGGSMKYGPFLNVRSGSNASDIDAVIFTKGEALEDLDWRGIMETDLFDEKDKLTFFARMSLQSNLVEDNLIDITSQRFTVAGEGYTISTHLMPTSYVEQAYPQTSDALPTTGTRHKYIRDYKERTFERTHVSNFDMSGNIYEIPVYNTPTQGGFIANNPAYSTVNGRYIPGMYQNLTLPQAHHVFGSEGMTAVRLNRFSKAVSDQEAAEKESIDPHASILNTEPRKPIISLDVSDILGE